MDLYSREYIYAMTENKARQLDDQDLAEEFGSGETPVRPARRGRNRNSLAGRPAEVGTAAAGLLGQFMRSIRRRKEILFVAASRPASAFDAAAANCSSLRE